MYAKVRTPRRYAPNQRKRDNTKETPKLADLRRLMTGPNLRCQVAKAMVDAGWCAGPGVEAEMNVAWQQREDARRHLRAEPHSSNLRKVVKMA